VHALRDLPVGEQNQRNTGRSRRRAASAGQLGHSERRCCGRCWPGDVGCSCASHPMRSRLLTPRSFGKGRGSVSWIEPTYLPADTTGMAKKPQPEPIVWSIFQVAAKAVRLGTVEAPDEAAAREKAAAVFKVPANRLMAIRR
jgi:hypothetical protein